MDLASELKRRLVFLTGWCAEVIASLALAIGYDIEAAEAHDSTPAIRDEDR